MKALFFLLFILLLTACVSKSNEENKAEQSVKYYLDSLEHNSKGYKIIAFKGLRPTYTALEDDPNYDRYKNNQSKLDSIKRRFAPKIRAWVIFVKFKGKDMYGNVGEHIFLCAIDQSLSKCSVVIETDNAPF
ncbi:MAG TPA: hypothetical protein VFE53_12775 [Mucilaginibacter sp.]|jgi:hypothetical protein|nr:hypothetical protein [Mucilaginibacter sp.]